MADRPKINDWCADSPWAELAMIAEGKYVEPYKLYPPTKTKLTDCVSWNFWKVKGWNTCLCR